MFRVLGMYNFGEPQKETQQPSLREPQISPFREPEKTPENSPQRTPEKPDPQIKSLETV